MVKTVLYVNESADNDFIRRLLRIHEEWEATLNRVTRPMCDDQRILRNENGIGIEIPRLLRATPAQYVGVPIALVTIDNDDIDDNGLLTAGPYRRGTTTADVTRRTLYPTDNRPPHGRWKIQLAGKSIRATTKFYEEILAGTVKPRLSWLADPNNQQ